MPGYEGRGRRVALVTGATRGAGRGIALALADAGYAVVVTGRSARRAGHRGTGSVDDTAAEVTRRGGLGVPVVCDHADDHQAERVAALVRGRFGRLDLLVNNALMLPDDLASPEPFWEAPLDRLSVLQVGLRSSYVMTWHAAPLLLAAAAQDPLVVMTSGFAAGCYLHGPAYGAARAGVDKMAHDMAVELRPENVAVVPLWLGLVRSGDVVGDAADVVSRYPQGEGPVPTESPQLVGRVIAALDADPDKLERSGQVQVAAELAAELGVREDDGTRPASLRERLGAPRGFNPAVVH